MKSETQIAARAEAELATYPGHSEWVIRRATAADKIQTMPEGGLWIALPPQLDPAESIGGQCLALVETNAYESECHQMMMDELLRAMSRAEHQRSLAGIGNYGVAGRIAALKNLIIELENGGEK